jgi:hypothetical protein
MSTQTAVQTQANVKPVITPVTGGVLQRACACGQHTSSGGGECEECRRKREGILERAAVNTDHTHEGSSFSHDATVVSNERFGSSSALPVPTLSHNFSQTPAFASSRIRIQPKLLVNKPGDEYEKEADRTADRVLNQLSFQRPFAGQSIQSVTDIGIVQRSGCTNCDKEEEEDIPVAISSGAPDILQREVDPDEEAADAAANAAMAEPEVEGNNEDEEDDDENGDEVVQAKHDPDPFTLESSDVTDHLLGAINQTRNNGRPIGEPIRSRMNSAFGADFGSVRLHTDNYAANLARSIHALAFTHGRDIFFGAGHYDLQSTAGLRLLAHELTHVVQQGAAPSSWQSAHSEVNTSILQLQSVRIESVKSVPVDTLLGEVYFFDAKGRLLQKVSAFQGGNLGILPGYYEIELKVQKPGLYDLHIIQGGKYTFEATRERNTIERARKKAAQVFLLVYGKPSGTQSDKSGSGKQSDEPEKEPSPNDPTGPTGSSKDNTTPPSPAGGHSKPPDNTDIEKTPQAGRAGSKPQQGDDNSSQGTDTGDSGKDDDSAADTDAGAGKKKGPALPGAKGDDKSGDIGIPGSKRSGSKYGVFGLLKDKVPQEVIDALEEALDTLGDSQEMEALAETLRTLKDLVEHRDALAELFKDYTSLLEIALGLKDNAAVDALAAWTARDIKVPSRSRNPNRKGIAALASKLTATAGKLRKILKPVFKVRSTIQSALGGVGLLLESMPALETLLDMAQDPSKLNDLDIQAAWDKFVIDFADEFKLKLDFAPKFLKDSIQKFSEADLVTYEELARAVTAAILAVIPKKYQPIAKATKELGLDKTIADNVIAPIIPEDAFNGINDIIRSLIKLLEPTLNSAADDLQKILDELGSGFLEEFPKSAKGLIKPSRKPGSIHNFLPSADIARLISQSASEPLNENIRADVETRMGQLFGNIRLHTDSTAAEVSERLHANAFAIGNDVYFGPGKFNPDTSEGRHLLYHELAHTTQQSQNGLALQPDYKDLLKRLAKRFSASIIAELRGATSNSPAKQKQVTTIKDKVEKLLGRKVISRKDPPLPTGYMYIPKIQGKIKTIRRALAWIRFIPALTIDKTGRIRLSATLSRFDPRKAARAALRASLGCTSKEEAHHIIPLELFFHPVCEAAVKNGFRFNGPQNGICLSNKIHAGSHGMYTGDVRARLDRLRNNPAIGTDWAKLQRPFEKEVDNLRQQLKLRKTKLK